MAFNIVLLALRVIVAALTAGPVVLCVVLIAFDFGPRSGAPVLGDFMTFSAIVVCCAALAVRVTLTIILRRGRRSLSREQAMTLFGIRTLGGVAVFAFATFWALAAMMLENSSGAFAVALVSTAAVASHFPTKSAVHQWMRDS